jgi:hypothetical protein
MASARKRSASRGFSKPALRALDEVARLEIRSGTAHRYTSIWVVVVEGRVFVRSWNDDPGGWYAAFAREPRGSVRFAGRSLAVRARLSVAPRLARAVTEAYAKKYTSPAQRKYARGFALPRRLRATVELVPRGTRAQTSRRKRTRVRTPHTSAKVRRKTQSE